MELDIINFLPKYPNIKQLDTEILNPYDEDFYEVIYKKKEFYDEKLPDVEEFPDVAGTLMKHQKLLARFFSSYTYYDSLLLVHEMGSGKTCSAIGAIEQIKSEGGGFRGALYLAKGEALINNFINELIFKCTDGRYIPEGYNELTKLEKIHRKKKAIKDYYSLNTFETFAKNIKNMNNVELQKKYNNFIIVIDEVHNLRIQSKEKGINIYAQFFRFLHVVKDCKILLMSGTPMKDGVEEISSVMNLILPDNQQLPTGEEFITNYFIQDTSNGVFKVKTNKVNELKAVFKGRVTYLKAMKSQINKVFIGNHIGNLNHLKVVIDYMSDFQSNSYNIAYNSDRNERKGVYSKSRQASLFVFPDGSYGDYGFNKYIVKKVSRRVFIGDDGKKERTYTYSMKNELYEALKGETQEDMLNKLAKYSSKYAASIRNILLAKQEGKSVFLYNEYVQGSGLILFGMILELFGFSKASGNEPVSSEKPRYASLTNMTSTTSQIRELVDRFNKPDNMNGKIINVIMGSRKISEGFSLFNVQVEEIHTPWFNYSETSQAIARGYRLGSHRMLLESGIVPQVSIYQRVSLPIENEHAIDLEMYEISEIKDISIKGVERIMKVSAWDCALNYERNHVVGYDGDRECDYMECNYECDGVPTELIIRDLSNNELDYSTFQVYYGSSNVKQIIKEILQLFRKKFRIDLNTIIDYFPQYSGFELVTALHTMINESTQIINKYGFTSYMKEENNIFFLVDSLSVTGTFASEYYTQFPSVKKTITFSNVIKPLYFKSLPSIIQLVHEAQTLNDIRKIMSRLPIEVYEFFIEGSILARELGIKKNVESRKLILEYFENYYTNLDGVWVSWLLYEEQELIRCLENNVWRDCTEDYIDRIENIKTDIQSRLENNPYGLYGQYNSKQDEFCIRDVRDVIPDKKNQRTSGKRCVNWNRSELIHIALEILKIEIPPESEMEDREKKKWQKIKTMNKDEIVSEILNNKYVKDHYDENLSKNDLLRILFWGKAQLKPICKYIYNWFEKQDPPLLVEDPGCGKTGKLKI